MWERRYCCHPAHPSSLFSRQAPGDMFFSLFISSCSLLGFCYCCLSFLWQGLAWSLEGSAAPEMVESSHIIMQHPCLFSSMWPCFGEQGPFPGMKPVAHHRTGCEGLTMLLFIHVFSGSEPDLLLMIVVPSLASGDLHWWSGPFSLYGEPAAQHSWRMTKMMRQLITKLT